MSCILTFKIGDTVINVPHDGALITDDIDNNLMTLLKSSELWKSISQAIELRLRDKVGTYKTVSLSDLTGLKGLIPNANVQFLQSLFPEVDFPEDISANILFLNNLKIGGKKYFGRVIKADGSELFIINNDRYSVGKLAKFLYLKSLLKNGFVFSEDSEQYKILNKIRGEKTINELIEDFSINKDKYEKKIITIDEKKILVYNYLDEILKIITDVPLRKQYNDEFTNGVNSLLKYEIKNKKSIAKLNIENLYTLIKAFHPEVLPEKVTSSKTFKSYFGTKESLTEEESKIYKNGYHKLLSSLLDNIFPLSYSRNDAINIIFLSSNTVENIYDISYQTISMMEIVENDYNGYKIYAQNVEGNTYYFPSKHYLTEDTITTRFETIDEARDYIDLKNNTEDIRENAYIEFNLKSNKDGSITSPKYLLEGTIITVKYKELPETLENVYQSQLLRKGNTRSDFERVVNNIKISSNEFLSDEMKIYILDNIKTPEDIALFIYDLKEINTEEEIKIIVDNITKLPKKSYYIESRKRSGSKENPTYDYKIIETEPNVIEQYKKAKNVPTVTIMKEIAKSFKSKFGVEVNILNRDQMQEQFPDLDEGVKAFIRNGNIYVNTFAARSSDLLHEYTHLLLGVLKSNPESVHIYEQLLNMVMESKEFDVKQVKDRINRNYPDLSEMDKREEVFAELFGRYLSGRGSNINDIFKQLENFLKKENLNIFDLTSDTDLKSIYNKSLSSIFERFSSDVATKLREDTGLDFSETINTRKKANWISKEIKEGRILEDCNG